MMYVQQVQVIFVSKRKVGIELRGELSVLKSVLSFKRTKRQFLTKKKTIFKYFSMTIRDQ
jgi:hypothetical protein